MNEDIAILLQLIENSVYLQMASVRAGASYEHPDAQAARSARTTFSNDETKRNRQYSHLWARSARTLADHGVTYACRNVPGDLTLPYRRRAFIVRVRPGLVRLVEVLDRIRIGLLDQLSDPNFHDRFKTSEWLVIGWTLLLAISQYNLPAVVACADQHADVRAGLERLLGITDAEWRLMRELEGTDWAALHEGFDYFGRFNR